MSDLFDVERSVMALIARETGRIVDFDWLTAIVYLITIVIGAVASGYLMNAQTGRAPKDRAYMDAGASPWVPILHTSVSALLAAALYYILTGRIFVEYIVVLTASVIGTRIFFVIADAVIGISDIGRKEKIRILGNIHMGVAPRVLVLGLLVVMTLALYYTWWVALQTSFRVDLSETAVETRVAILLFVIPAMLGFVLQMPIYVPALANKYLDGQVRSYVLSRLVPVCLTASIMVVLPSVVFGEEARAYIAWLPELDDLVWLPLSLFLAVGVIPFGIGLLNHQSFIIDCKKFHRGWLQQLSEALGDPQRLETQKRALVNEMVLMARRSRYYENYMYALANRHFGDDSEKLAAFEAMIGMSRGMLDQEQFNIIADKYAELPLWDYPTTLIDDLFLYWSSLEDGTVTADKIAVWTNRLGADNDDLRRDIVSPITTAVVSGLAGPAFAWLYAYAETLLTAR